MNRYAIDFETYFDRKVSLTTMTPEEYLAHPDVDAYLASVYGEGLEYSGPPALFDWRSINGAEWLAHNYRFDGAVIERLKRDGVIPKDVYPSRTVCTADLSVYLCGYRDLKGAYKALLGREVSKAYRGTANGRHGWEFSEEEMEELRAAGLADAKACYELYEECGKDWPRMEQDFSELTREGSMHGVRIDRKLALECVETCDAALSDAESRIPWMDEFRASKLKTPTAARFIKAQCSLEGVVPPSTFNKKEPEFVKWYETNLERFGWLAAVRQWSELSRGKTIIETALSLAGVDDVLRFQIKYFGAFTGRTSGGSDDEV